MNFSWYLENNINIDDCVGIDEVGRGPLAGPVVAAAVWVNGEFVDELRKSAIIVRDSKKMTPKQRAATINWLKKFQSPELIRYAIEGATVEEIDNLNILNAALLAMKRAFDSLGFHKKYSLVDGNRAPVLKNTEIRTIINGDEKVISISLASIIAKEYRDCLMRKLALEYPNYGWDTNVGYGSKAHIQAILKYGITPHHRKTFAPIKKRSLA
ncbi:MAG: ribonuclease HII [Holosporaceae bacterium]|jgi:ribonuclease HII|nr:ribonuclease HII [Holosporaceae bacterium]